MGQVKTGISLDEQLFHEGEALARELGMTRSGLYARALADFIERRKSRQLLDELDAAYSDGPQPEDETLLRAVRRTMRRVSDPWA